MAVFTFKAAEIWDALMQDCAAAQRAIEVEQYILMDDNIGVKFLTLLRDKAAAGVEVRLLIDRVGSRAVCDHPLVMQLRQHGARVQIYNRLKWSHLLAPQRCFPRNHAKTAMIDGRIFHIGSACMADDMAGWQEAHVRIEGETIENIEQDFQYHPEKPDNGYRYLRSQPGRRNPIYHEMLNRIHGAQRSICLATPYLLPPSRLKRALRDAARKNIKVDILTAGSPDVAIAGVVGQTYFEKMRRWGINIHLYDRAMFHGKYMVIDDNWAMIGSANLDYLSMLRNREANLVIDDADGVAALGGHFKQMTAQSRIVDENFWPRVPWPEKLAGYLGRSMKKVL